MARSRRSKCPPLTVTACVGGDPDEGVKALQTVVTIFQESIEAAGELAEAAETAIREEFQAIRGTDEDPWDEPTFIDTTLGDQQLAGFRAWVATQPEERRAALLANEPAPNYDHMGELAWKTDRMEAWKRARERLGVDEERWAEKWWFTPPTKDLNLGRAARRTGRRCFDVANAAFEAGAQGEKVPLPDGFDPSNAPFIDGVSPPDEEEP